MNDGHFIDDPLNVVNVTPDFSGLGMEPIHKNKGTMEEIDKWIETMKDFQEFMVKYPTLNVQEADSPSFDTSDIIDFIIFRLEHLK